MMVMAAVPSDHPMGQQGWVLLGISTNTHVTQHKHPKSRKYADHMVALWQPPGASLLPGGI